MSPYGRRCDCRLSFSCCGETAFRRSDQTFRARLRRGLVGEPWVPPRSELQSVFAGGVGEGLHASVVKVAAAVEDHRGDARSLRPFGDELADGGGGVGAAG